MNTANTSHVFYRSRRKVLPTIERAEGVYLYGADGKKYLDGSGGPMVVNIGHGVKEIIDAMVQQARKVCFTYNGMFTTLPEAQLAEKIINLCPDGYQRVYFVSGGSEACEIALKFVVNYHAERGNPKKYRVISRWMSYHGSTMMCLSVGGHVSRRQHYLQSLHNYPHASAVYCYRCPYGKSYPACGIDCAWDLERVIRLEGSSTIGAFLAEPIIGGSATAVVPPPEYYKIVRQICDRYDMLYIADEVVVGFGRTGKNFGFAHWDVKPDIIFSGKGISSGYTPLGVVILREDVSDTLMKGKDYFLGYTYSSNPFSCAIGLSVLNYLEGNDLFAKVNEIGDYMGDKLERFRDHALVGDIRRAGLLIGIEFVSDKEKKTPFPADVKLAERIHDKALENGLVVLPGKGSADGILGDHITLSPPFIISERQVDELIEQLEKTINEVYKEL
jgi:adenosylmethionine-8-amino-7-oxononanoate aminotransferase